MEILFKKYLSNLQTSESVCKKACCAVSAEIVILEMRGPLFACRAQVVGCSATMEAAVQGMSQGMCFISGILRVFEKMAEWRMHSGQLQEEGMGQPHGHAAPPPPP